MSASPIPLESLHPSLWRGSQLARGGSRTIATGYPALSAELPGGGWPVGGLVELLVPHAGCGEMRLLAPGLAGTVAESRPLALVARRIRRTRRRWPNSACRSMRCCGYAQGIVAMRCGQPSNR